MYDLSCIKTCSNCAVKQKQKSAVSETHQFPPLSASAISGVQLEVSDVPDCLLIMISDGNTVTVSRLWAGNNVSLPLLCFRLEIILDLTAESGAE